MVQRALCWAPLLALAAAHDQAAEDFSCAAADQEKLCFANPSGRIGSGDGSSADACCASCKQHAGCAAWTHWGQGKCNLFSNVGRVTDSDPTCTSGIGKKYDPELPPSDPEAPPSQPWKCAQPQPDGSCVKGAPTQAQWEFAQKSRTNVQGPPCKDCPSE